MVRGVWFILAFGLLTLGAASCGAGSHNGYGASRAVFMVTGSASKGVSVTWGDNRATYYDRFPLHKTVPVNERLAYYFVSAQLTNGGNVTCKLIIGSASSVRHARGKQNACTARLQSDFGGGWRH